MNIGEVAEMSGLPAKTIRYYEEIGLVRPRREPNGYRRFGPREMHKLRFLARARGLGFSIEDCRELIALYDDEDRSAGEVRKLAESHLARIEGKIAELQSLRAALTELIASCHGEDRPDCPILDDLAGLPQGRHAAE